MRVCGQPNGLVDDVVPKNKTGSLMQDYIGIHDVSSGSQGLCASGGVFQHKAIIIIPVIYLGTGQFDTE